MPLLTRYQCNVSLSSELIVDVVNDMDLIGAIVVDIHHVGGNGNEGGGGGGGQLLSMVVCMHKVFWKIVHAHTRVFGCAHMRDECFR